MPGRASLKININKNDSAILFLQLNLEFETHKKMWREREQCQWVKVKY
jgi:hypothetical protein